MLQIFLFYTCEFATSPEIEDHGLIERELMFAWSWSILQRIIFNEPLTIVSARALPMLLQSNICRACCSETLLDLIAQAVETVAGIVKEAMS